MDDFDNALSSLGVKPAAAPVASNTGNMQADIAAPMGPDRGAMAREIAATSHDIQTKNLDPQSAELLRGHLADMQRQFAGASQPAAGQPAQVPGEPPRIRMGQYDAAPKDDFDNALKALTDAPANSAVGADKPTAHWNDRTNPVSDLVANQVSSLGSTIAGGYAGLYSGAKTLYQTGDKDKALDAAVDTINNVKQQGTYTPRNPASQNLVEKFDSSANPIQWPGIATQYVGDKLGDASAEAGFPAAGAALKGIGAVAPMALGFKGVRGQLGRLSDLVKTAGNESPTLSEAPPRIDPTLETPNAPKSLYKLVNGKPELVTAGEQSSAPAAAVSTAPPAPSQPVPTTPEGIRYAAQNAPAALFPDTPTSAPAGTKFSPAEQLARAKILESVGMNPDTLRKSALSGDGMGGNTDVQINKLETSGGREMRSVIEQEKAALSDHAQSLVKDTGGTFGTDEATQYARGNTIIAPLDSLKAWFDKRTSELYKAADERAQGVSQQLGKFKSILDDPSEYNNSEIVTVKDAISSFAKKIGMVGDDGNISGSAKQAEVLRAELNSKWSPANNKFIGKLKDAIDDDVMESAGSEIYSKARQMRTLRAKTLDNPDGIAKLMNASGPEGINRSVPVERLANNVTGMPVDQFSHVVNTLKNLPAEMQTQGASSLGEIKAQFANQIHDIGSKQAGQWAAKNVTTYLQKNAARMAEVFTPEEMAKFRNLNDAGHIVAKDQSYPGGPAQGHNLMTHGMMVGLQGGGAVVGSLLGMGPLGTAAGGLAGAAAANAVGEASSLRLVKKRMVKLSELAPVK